MKRLLPLHIHISTLFLILVVIVGALIGGTGYKLSRDMAEEAADETIARIGRETLSEVEQVVAPAEMASKLLRAGLLNDASDFNARMKQLPRVVEALKSADWLSSVYVGYASGDFFLVRRVKSYPVDAPNKAPDGTAYVIQSIDHSTQPAQGRYIFLNEDLSTLADIDMPQYPSSYDPRQRGWYKEAMVSSTEIMTAPYLFFSNQRVGTTVAMRTTDRMGVVGADLLLETIGESLAKQKVTKGSQLALVNGDGYIIAHEDVKKLVTFDKDKGVPSLTKLEQLGVPVMVAIAPLIPTIQGDKPLYQKIQLESAKWLVSVTPMIVKGSKPLYLVNAIPDAELLASANSIRNTSAILTIVIILLAIPVTWYMANSISKPLRELMGETQAIQRFEFSNPIDVKSNVYEVHSLAVTLASMKRTIRRFLDISQAVAAEENFDKLLPTLLSETISAANANSGILYLVDGDALVAVSALNKQGTDMLGGLAKLPTDSAGEIMGDAIRTGVPVASAMQAKDLQLLGLDSLQQNPDMAQGLAVPLRNRQLQLVGAMLLLRSEPVTEAEIAFINALSGSAASSIETKELIKSQKELFEAFIQLIANAIDAKSPYTGGHCERVPTLTKMLARAACDQTEGPFKDFILQEQDWEAVHVASWLHDCGKITTPEYVVDKATKLETIYDRIHEVRMRFEVLKRDAQIACLQSIVGGEDAAAANARLATEWVQIDDDFAFIATCNQGGEFMAADKVARLKAIGAKTWVRTLDDRAGVSYEELQRKEREPAVPLPAVESVLSDKPEHLFERSARNIMPEDNKWGFRMPVPALMYNKGEVYNLAVGRGTLSEEERYKINEHIVQTMIMLSELPFPKHLRQVPEIAGGHHEKMDGTGYPKRLKKEDMSPVARMMAVADVFEALTAVDRPYKKGKTLSEAIKIMGFMKKDQHLDPDLFELFLRSGVYKEYAKEFMKPEQIDEVNIEQFLAPPKAA